MKAILFTLGALAATLYSSGQYPDTEIYVADMRLSKDSAYFSTPQNVTNHPGYDNQPCFSLNGASLYYVAWKDDQTDVMCYSFSRKTAATVTRSDESEFSPGLSADGLRMTVVRIDTDSGQRAYTFPLERPEKVSVISGTDSIGYYCWLNDNELAMFILGSPHTLQVLNRNLLQRSRIAGDIGRCMKLSGDSTLLYFVIKHSETDWRIHSYHIKDHTVAEVASALPGNEDFAVLKNGTLLMGDRGLLYAMKSDKKKWEKVADFSASTGPFFRLVVSPQENKIALVVSAEKKP